MVLYWLHYDTSGFGAENVPLNLSIKNVPDHLGNLLRERAAGNHRSMQGELLAILEEALLPRRGLTPAEALDRVRRLGLRTPDEATDMIRADRETR